MILVTGATGTVGGELVRAMVEAGEAARALSRRDPPYGLPEGVEAAVGDLDRPGSLADALDGVDGVFLLPGYGDMPGLLAEIRRAGVGRVVLLSGSSAEGGDMSNAISRYTIVSETAVRESGVPSTILRPSGFMSNALGWAPQLRAGDVVRAPFAGVRVAAIDPFDIAAVAAEALISAGHEGRVYRLSGPEPLLTAEQVGVLSSVLGRDLRFEGQSDAEARAEMEAAMPTEYVDAFFDFYAEGTLDESEVYPTVEELTGAASSISETSSEFGGALGIAVLGSVATAVYRNRVAGVLPVGTPAGAAEAARDTLGGAVSAAEGLTGPLGVGLLEAARGAFTQALHAAALTSAAIALGTAVLVMVLLRDAQTNTETAGQPGRHEPAVSYPRPEEP